MGENLIWDCADDLRDALIECRAELAEAKAEIERLRFVLNTPKRWGVCEDCESAAVARFEKIRKERDALQDRIDNAVRGWAAIKRDGGWAVDPQLDGSTYIIYTNQANRALVPVLIIPVRILREESEG